jgi:hypothetical protein
MQQEFTQGFTHTRKRKNGWHQHIGIDVHEKNKILRDSSSRSS